MRIIRPNIITSAMVTASNVPEDDYPVWSISTTYAVGDRCISNHKIYYCLIANSGSLPEDNSTGTSPKWLDEGYDNRWRMFDDVVGTATEQSESITIDVVPGQADSIAFLDVQATTIDIVMNDPGDGEVYNETIDLVAKAAVVDAYTYMIEPIITDDTAIILVIPSYSQATYSITINYPGGTAKLGTLVFGKQKKLGITAYRPTISINDYSKKDVDQFGNFTILQRAYSKKLSAELQISSTNVDDIARTLAGYRTTPLIWIGVDSGYSSMVIYGFYKSFSVIITHATISTCSLEIIGLS